MIKFRKLPTDHPDRALFRGHPNANPAYLAELLFPILTGRERDADMVHPIARIERETMAGQGTYNMWGSRYRWIVATDSGRKYFDTLAKAKVHLLEIAHRAVRAVNF